MQTPSPPGRTGPLGEWFVNFLSGLETLLRPVVNPLRVFWLTGFCTVFFLVGIVFVLLNTDYCPHRRRGLVRLALASR